MRPLLRGLGTGILLGIAWGLVARVFMRLLSDDPGFSWSGTLFILGLAAVAGGGAGVVRAARRDGRSRWWRLAALPGALLFAGPGALLVPGAVGFALLHRGGRSLRVLGALLVPVSPLLLVALPGEDGSLVPPTPTQWAGVALLLLAVVPLGWGVGEIARSWRPRVVPHEAATREPAFAVG